MPGNLDLALRIRADLKSAERGLRQLDRRLDGLTTSGRQAGRAMTRTARQIDRVDDAAERADRGLGALRSGFIALGGIAAVHTITRIVRDIAESGVAFERLESRFRFAAGSIRAGAEELAFVRAEAERLGIDFRAAADAYSGLLAAAKGTNLGVAETREIFLGVAESARVMGLDAEQTRGALLALEQILSKGKVSAEELRGQLGERLPGAFQIAARAMGVTTAELDRMLAAGELVSEEFLPRFAQALRENVADAVPEAIDQADAEFQRLGNSIERLKESIARSGLLGFLAEAAERTAELVDLLASLTPSGAAQSVTDQLEAFDTQRLAELREELRLVELDIKVVRELLAGADTADRRSLFADNLEQLSAQAAELRRQIELLDPPQPLTVRITDSAPPDTTAQEKAAERAQRRITAIAERAAEARLRIEEDRFAASRRAEQRALAEVERIARSGLVGAEAIERARTEIRARGVAERDQLLRDQLDREAELAEERTETLEQGREDLRELERALLGPYDRAVAEINAWRAAQEAAFEAAGLSVEEYARTVEQVVMQRLAKAWEAEAARREEATQGWRAGARLALADYADSATRAGDAAERAVTQGLQGMEDALVQFVTTGKLEFGSLVDSIIADLARIAVQRTITGPLSEFLFGFLDDFGSSSRGLSFPSGSLGHSGGVAGALTRHRTGVDPRVFAFAPRLHRGGVAGSLRPDEVPTILRRGETVRTVEQERALQGALGAPMAVRVELVNRGQPQRVTEASATVDPREMVVRIVTEDLSVGGDIARSIASFVPGTTL